MDSINYPHEVTKAFLFAEPDSHVSAYDLHTFIEYRQAAKKRGDAGMTYALKQAVNFNYLSIRELRIKLLSLWPDYIEKGR